MSLIQLWLMLALIHFLLLSPITKGFWLLHVLC